MMVVDPTGQSYFRFIRISAVGLEIDEVVGLAICGAILTGTNVVVGFFGLSLG